MKLTDLSPSQSGPAWNLTTSRYRGLILVSLGQRHHQRSWLQAQEWCWAGTVESCGVPPRTSCTTKGTQLMSGNMCVATRDFLTHVWLKSLDNDWDGQLPAECFQHCSGTHLCKHHFGHTHIHTYICDLGTSPPWFPVSLPARRLDNKSRMNITSNFFWTMNIKHFASKCRSPTAARKK